MSERLKILMFAYAIDSKDVGEAQLTYQWIDQISKKVDVTLITMGSRINDRCGFENNPNVTLCLVKPKIRFRWTGAFDRVFKPDYFELFSRARKVAKELLSADAFDALHHIAPHSPRYPSPLYGLHENFLVGPIHGGLALPQNFVRKTLKTKVAANFRKLDGVRYRYDPVIRAHFSSARKLLVSAPYVKDILPSQFSEKCQIIPPQPPSKSLQEIDSSSDNGKVNFLFVGRLIENKGIRFAIEALRNIPKDSFTFTIYGKGEQENELRSLVKSYALDNIVIFKGFASHEAILSEMPTYDMLLFPSLKEAWGLVVTEAMSAGLGVICADRGGPGYIVDDKCGIKVKAETPSQLVRDLSNAILKVINDPGLVNSMSVNAIAKVECQFTWDVLIRDMLDLYQRKY